MWAVSGGLTRSKMAASNQGAEDRKMSAGREAVAAVPGAAPTVFLAIELSKASWIVALHSPAGARVSLHRLPAGDAKALLAFAEKARAAAAEATGEAAVAVASCYEAGYDGFWLHRVLVAAGVASLVVDPASLQVDRRARRAKTDRIDAQALLRALMAHHRHEPRVWSPVRVPTPADEDARRTHRERQNLLKERGRHVNRIKGLCAQQGIQGYEPIRPDRRERLTQLVTGDGRPLPPRLRAEIGRELRRLELVLEQIGAVEAERDAAAAAEVGEEARRAARIAALGRLKGIGPEIATVLGNEVFYRRFANRRQLAAYVGLAPSPYRSGGSGRDQGLSRAGNPRARTAVVELAWLWLRHQPGSPLSAWFVRRVGGLKGRIKRIMVVALARKLLLALWRYLEAGLVPEGAVLKG
jgi:transposase